MKTCGYEKLDDIYGIPWFHSEPHEIDAQRKRMYSLLCGTWNGDEFGWVEGVQLVDPFLRGNASVSAAIGVGLVVKRQKRWRLNAFDAIVFSEPLNLPDIILGHQSVPEMGYIKNDLKQVEAYDVPGAAGMSVWSATSDPRGCGFVYTKELDTTFKSRKCIIQVIDGRCVVFTNFFQAGNHSSAARSQEAIENDLEFAQTIFKFLQRASQLNSKAEAKEQSSTNSSLPSDSFFGRALPSEPLFGSKLMGSPTASMMAADSLTAAPHQKPLKDFKTKKSFSLEPQVVFGALLILGGIALLILPARLVGNLPQKEFLGLVFAVGGGICIAVGKARVKTKNLLLASQRSARQTIKG